MRSKDKMRAEIVGMLRSAREAVTNDDRRNAIRHTADLLDFWELLDHYLRQRHGHTDLDKLDTEQLRAALRYLTTLQDAHVPPLPQASNKAPEGH